MKVLVLTWEFPPRLVGGIARHVAELYPELVQRGHEVHLVTIEFGHAPHYEMVNGIHVHRVSVVNSDDFFQWVAHMNDSMGHHGGKLLQTEGNFDLIHAHDWLVADAAIALKHLFKVPLVATIHATEFGRYNGIHNGIQQYVCSKEQALAYEAWRVIVCTNYMRLEVERALGTPWNKLDVVYNGIHCDRHLPINYDPTEFRRRFAADQEKIIYYVGRMTYEKGISVLLHAAPRIIGEMGGHVKFVLIGNGRLDDFKRQAWDMGIWEKCYFTGFMSDDDLNCFRLIANCAVFPSLYEPFGIVALENFAARIPVVVSDAGGFPEVVRHGVTGIVTLANNADSLAWGILEILKRPEYSQWLVENAALDLERRFGWAQLAQQTEAVYGRVLHERLQVVW